ncbi:MAG TPA: amidohydrolase family protein [Gemmatimonadales bacterium]
MTYQIVTEDQTLCIDAGVVVHDGRRPDLVVPFGSGRLYPGLINAHDHLHRNHYPRLGTPPYANAYEWGDDIHRRHAEQVKRGRGLAREQALLWGALKNLLGGVTTVVHHDRWEPAFDYGFPIRVAPVRVAHSLRLEPGIPSLLEPTSPQSHLPLCIHLAEGGEPAAAAEIHEARRMGLVDERLIAVHVVSIDSAGVAALREAGAAVAWCPTSNEFLFGQTTPRELFDSGIDVLLGTDALLTGQGTLLDEVRAARRYGYLSDHRLAGAVCATAARRLAMKAPSLATGNAADAVLLRRPLWEAMPADVALVLVDGKPGLADRTAGALFEFLGISTEELTVGGVPKLVPAPLGTIARIVAAQWPEAARVLA